MTPILSIGQLQPHTSVSTATGTSAAAGCAGCARRGARATSAHAHGSSRRTCSGAARAPALPTRRGECDRGTPAASRRTRRCRARVQRAICRNVVTPSWWSIRSSTGPTPTMSLRSSGAPGAEQRWRRVVLEVDDELPIACGLGDARPRAARTAGAGRRRIRAHRDDGAPSRLARRFAAQPRRRRQAADDARAFPGRRCVPALVPRLPRLRGRACRHALPAGHGGRPAGARAGRASDADPIDDGDADRQCDQREEGQTVHGIRSVAGCSADAAGTSAAGPIVVRAACRAGHSRPSGSARGRLLESRTDIDHADIVRHRSDRNPRRAPAQRRRRARGAGQIRVRRSGTGGRAAHAVAGRRSRDRRRRLCRVARPAARARRCGPRWRERLAGVEPALAQRRAREADMAERTARRPGARSRCSRRAIAESQTQQAALEALYRDLAPSRDEIAL